MKDMPTEAWKEVRRDLDGSIKSVFNAMDSEDWRDRNDKIDVLIDMLQEIKKWRP